MRGTWRSAESQWGGSSEPGSSEGLPWRRPGILPGPWRANLGGRGDWVRCLLSEYCKKRSFSWTRLTRCFRGGVNMRIYTLPGSQETPPAQQEAMVRADENQGRHRSQLRASSTEGRAVNGSAGGPGQQGHYDRCPGGRGDECIFRASAFHKSPGTIHGKFSRKGPAWSPHKVASPRVVHPVRWFLPSLRMPWEDAICSEVSRQTPLDQTRWVLR